MEVKVAEVVDAVVGNLVASILCFTTWHVSPDGTGNSSLGQALQKARGGDTIVAAPGIYFPGTKRCDSFVLKKNVTLQGAGESSILSGEIGEDGTEDNSYHVVIGADYATLVGFTITGGNANGQTIPSLKDAKKKADQWSNKSLRSKRKIPEPQVDTKGGGMRNDGITMTLKDCVFEYNNAIYGGAMYNTHEANVTIENCKFVRNSAKEGGAVYNYDLSSPTITLCVFKNNSASRGGAILNRYASSPTITKSEFFGNDSLIHGGAICNDYGASPQIEDSTFIQNNTAGDGGAIFTDDTASQFGKTSPCIRGCTFEENVSTRFGGAIANYNKCTPVIESSIFDGNQAKSGGAIGSLLGVQAQVTQCEFLSKSDTVITHK